MEAKRKSEGKGCLPFCPDIAGEYKKRQQSSGGGQPPPLLCRRRPGLLRPPVLHISHDAGKRKVDYEIDRHRETEQHEDIGDVHGSGPIVHVGRTHDLLRARHQLDHRDICQIG